MTIRQVVAVSAAGLLLPWAGCCVPWNRYRARELDVRRLEIRVFDQNQRLAGLQTSQQRLRRALAGLRRALKRVGIQNRDRTQELKECRVQLARVKRSQAALRRLTGAGGPGPAGRKGGRPPGAVRKPVALVAGGWVSSGRNWKAVRAVLLAAQNRFVKCYATVGLKERPRLQGDLHVMFAVGPSGAVGSAAVIKTSFGHRGTETCVVRTLHRLRFPVLRQSPVAFVRFPLRFRLR